MNEYHMICIVCNEPACRRFGGEKYSEYYCRRHNPNDRKKQEEESRKMSKRLKTEGSKNREYAPRETPRSSIMAEREVRN
jgi:hypothetical protein